MVEKKERYPEEVFYDDYIIHFIDINPVLDIGCGTGWLGKHKASLYGIDINEDKFRFSKSYKKFTVSDLNKPFPFKDGFFKGAIAKDILEHIRDPLSFMREVNRILQTGGKVFLSVPLPKRSFWDDYTHQRPYTKNSIIALLEDSGFAIEKLYYQGNFPGLGLISKIFKISRTPLIFRLLTAAGINRNNINVISIKK